MQRSQPKRTDKDLIDEQVRRIEEERKLERERIAEENRKKEESDRASIAKALDQIENQRLKDQELIAKELARRAEERRIQEQRVMEVIERERQEDEKRAKEEAIRLAEQRRRDAEVIAREMKRLEEERRAMEAMALERDRIAREDEEYQSQSVGLDDRHLQEVPVAKEIIVTQTKRNVVAAQADGSGESQVRNGLNEADARKIAEQIQIAGAIQQRKLLDKSMEEKALEMDRKNRELIKKQLGEQKSLIDNEKKFKQQTADSKRIADEIAIANARKEKELLNKSMEEQALEFDRRNKLLLRQNQESSQYLEGKEKSSQQKAADDERIADEMKIAEARRQKELLNRSMEEQAIENDRKRREIFRKRETVEDDIEKAKADEKIIAEAKKEREILNKSMEEQALENDRKRRETSNKTSQGSAPRSNGVEPVSDSKRIQDALLIAEAKKQKDLLNQSMEEQALEADRKNRDALKKKQLGENQMIEEEKRRKQKEADDKRIADEIKIAEARKEKELLNKSMEEQALEFDRRNRDILKQKQDTETVLIEREKSTKQKDGDDQRIADEIKITEARRQKELLNRSMEEQAIENDRKRREISQKQEVAKDDVEKARADQRIIAEAKREKELLNKSMEEKALENDRMRSETSKKTPLDSPPTPGGVEPDSDSKKIQDALLITEAKKQKDLLNQSMEEQVLEADRKNREAMKKKLIGENQLIEEEKQRKQKAADDKRIADEIKIAEAKKEKELMNRSMEEQALEFDRRNKDILKQKQDLEQDLIKQEKWAQQKCDDDQRIADEMKIAEARRHKELLNQSMEEQAIENDRKKTANVKAPEIASDGFNKARNLEKVTDESKRQRDHLKQSVEEQTEKNDQEGKETPSKIPLDSVPRSDKVDSASDADKILSELRIAEANKQKVLSNQSLEEQVLKVDRLQREALERKREEEKKAIEEEKKRNQVESDNRKIMEELQKAEAEKERKQANQSLEEKILQIDRMNRDLLQKKQAAEKDAAVERSVHELKEDENPFYAADVESPEITQQRECLDQSKEEHVLGMEEIVKESASKLGQELEPPEIEDLKQTRQSEVLEETTVGMSEANIRSVGSEEKPAIGEEEIEFTDETESKRNASLLPVTSEEVPNYVGPIGPPFMLNDEADSGETQHELEPCFTGEKDEAASVVESEIQTSSAINKTENTPVSIPNSKHLASDDAEAGQATEKVPNSNLAMVDTRNDNRKIEDELKQTETRKQKELLNYMLEEQALEIDRKNREILKDEEENTQRLANAERERAQTEADKLKIREEMKIASEKKERELLNKSMEEQALEFDRRNKDILKQKEDLEKVLIEKEKLAKQKRDDDQRIADEMKIAEAHRQKELLNKSMEEQAIENDRKSKAITRKEEIVKDDIEKAKADEKIIAEAKKERELLNKSMEEKALENDRKRTETSKKTSHDSASGSDGLEPVSDSKRIQDALLIAEAKKQKDLLNQSMEEQVLEADRKNREALKKKQLGENQMIDEEKRCKQKEADDKRIADEIRIAEAKKEKELLNKSMEEQALEFDRRNRGILKQKQDLEKVLIEQEMANKQKDGDDQRIADEMKITEARKQKELLNKSMEEQAIENDRRKRGHGLNRSDQPNSNEKYKQEPSIKNGLDVNVESQTRVKIIEEMKKPKNLGERLLGEANEGTGTITETIDTSSTTHGSKSSEIFDRSVEMRSSDDEKINLELMKIEEMKRVADEKRALEEEAIKASKLAQEAEKEMIEKARVEEANRKAEQQRRIDEAIIREAAAKADQEKKLADEKRILTEKVLEEDRKRKQKESEEAEREKNLVASKKEETVALQKALEDRDDKIAAAVEEMIIAQEFADFESALDERTEGQAVKQSQKKVSFQPDVHEIQEAFEPEIIVKKVSKTGKSVTEPAQNVGDDMEIIAKELRTSEDDKKCKAESKEIEELAVAAGNKQKDEANRITEEEIERDNERQAVERRQRDNMLVMEEMQKAEEKKIELENRKALEERVLAEDRKLQEKKKREQAERKQLEDERKALEKAKADELLINEELRKAAERKKESDEKAALLEKVMAEEQKQKELAKQKKKEEPPKPKPRRPKSPEGASPEEDMELFEQFLVSFMVDARGGAMRGCRHSGVRVIIPPRKAASPMRITCRYLKKDKLVHAPPLMEGEALASRILEMGPQGAKFLGPVILEVPHFASLRGKEREIVILRSDNGETWREHTLEATEDAVQEVLNESFDGEELKQLDDLNTSRITRILTTDFPQYFAIVTRIRQEVHAIGPDGGMVSSTVVPQVQAVFPQGALTKKIKVGLQAQPISPDLAAKLLGNRVAVSPIVTVEPRRRKFHKPITLTLPVPQAANKGMINQYSGDAPTLRLLCSITGGTTRAQWEDVTGSTPLTFVNDCVSFTTTVSARFWLMDCTNIPEATRMATELYREAIHVPFMSKFVVFAKRHQQEEARLRVFCMTDDREDKTLECQENFAEVAKSRDVEVLEGKTQYLEFAGNIVPVTKSGDQLSFNFYAFRENRLPFTVRVKDQHAEPVGRVAFMRQPKVGRGDAPQNPICNLNLELPDTILPEPAPSEPDLLSLEKKYTFLSISKADTIHKADLRLSDISNMLSGDWVALARGLDVGDSDINIIKSQYPDNDAQQALVMLRLWMQSAGNKATGNALEQALRQINRVDIVNKCIFNVEPVTDDKERAVAKAQIDSSVVADSPQLGRRKDDHDHEDVVPGSAVDDDHKQTTYQGKEPASDLSPTYESEEKKYAAEEKVFPAEPKTVQSGISQDLVDEFLKDTEGEFDQKFHKIVHAPVTEKVPEEYAGKEVVEEEFVKTIVSKVREEPEDETVTTTTIVRDGDAITKTTVTKTVVESSDEPSSFLRDSEQVVTKRTFDDGSQSIITTKTTERRSFIVDDDDASAVKEKIVLEQRKDAQIFDEQMKKLSPSDPSAKSDMLQKLGEELGKLDDRLEETFKEKRKAAQPDEEVVAAADRHSVQEDDFKVLPRNQGGAAATFYQIVDTPPASRKLADTAQSGGLEDVSISEASPTSTIPSEVADFAPISMEKSEVVPLLVETSEVEQPITEVVAAETAEDDLKATETAQQITETDASETAEEDLKATETAQPITEADASETTGVDLKPTETAQPISSTIETESKIPLETNTTLATSETTEETPDGGSIHTVTTTTVTSTSTNVPATEEMFENIPDEFTQTSEKIADVPRADIATSLTTADTAVLPHDLIFFPKFGGTKSYFYRGFLTSAETDRAEHTSRDHEKATESAAARILDLEAARSAELDSTHGIGNGKKITSVKDSSVYLKGTTPQAETTPIPLITPLDESLDEVLTSDRVPPTSKLKPKAVTEGVASLPLTHSETNRPEEQDERLIMRDSPRWEEEEIKIGRDREDNRVIKAEVKLLVHTTESGKETIEIRSIEEFVEVPEKYPGGFGEIISSTSSGTGVLDRSEERVFTLHRMSPCRSPSPRFVRPSGIEEGSYISEATPDEFNLMSQIRDIEGAPTSATTSKKKTKKKGKKENK
ncbi:centrosomal protein of 290 kDa isoform X8 [Hyalella azteca]|uniref:Centrosomal protein of 290 kDa isoform X8 n=1 Tax=Hyalella azteca TaxID=294128 RepID=A0A979FQ72_HYAAZ|nr:centrosomal protein of 290 kDa isoform X8 [Hyalella azteca]